MAGDRPELEPTILDQMPTCLVTAVASPFPATFSQQTIDSVLSSRNGFGQPSVHAGGKRASGGTMAAKIVLLGDAAVGKTCLFYRIFRNEFTDLYKTTIGVDFCLLDYVILSVPFRLQLWDTAGSERFKALTYGYYRGAQVVILTFDVTASDAVQSLRNWHSEISTMLASHNTRTQPMFFVVGTKIDLIKGVEDEISATASLKLQEVEQKVNDFCLEIGAELWLTSSKCNINVDAFFNRVAALLFDDIVCRSLDEKSGNCIKLEEKEDSSSRPGSGKIRLKPDANLKGTLTRQESMTAKSCCR